MRTHDLLPDPPALGGDQPRGGTGPRGGFTRCDDYPGCLCSPHAYAPRLGRNRRAQILGMTASTDTLQTVRSLSREGYKYGFVTDIEADAAELGKASSDADRLSSRHLLFRAQEEFGAAITR